MHAVPYCVANFSVGPRIVLHRLAVLPVCFKVVRGAELFFRRQYSSSKGRLFQQASCCSDCSYPSEPVPRHHNLISWSRHAYLIRGQSRTMSIHLCSYRNWTFLDETKFEMRSVSFCFAVLAVRTKVPYSIHQTLNK